MRLERWFTPGVRPDKGRRKVVHGWPAEPPISIIKMRQGKIGLADTRGLLQHRVKNRRKLARRRTDDAQYFGCRRLLLQRLGQVVGALAQFVEQPRVLDGDDRLGGEVLDQRDLLVGKRPHFLAVDADGPDQLIL